MSKEMWSTVTWQPEGHVTRLSTLLAVPQCCKPQTKAQKTSEDIHLLNHSQHFQQPNIRPPPAPPAHMASDHQRTITYNGLLCLLRLLGHHSACRAECTSRPLAAGSGAGQVVFLFSRPRGPPRAPLTTASIPHGLQNPPSSPHRETGQSSLRNPIR